MIYLVWTTRSERKTDDHANRRRNWAVFVARPSTRKLRKRVLRGNSANECSPLKIQIGRCTYTIKFAKHQRRKELDWLSVDSHSSPRPTKHPLRNITRRYQKPAMTLLYMRPPFHPPVQCGNNPTLDLVTSATQCQEKSTSTNEKAMSL